jgi:protein-S-isoprenylcysteine O-methyltransferase Ste14
MRLSVRSTSTRTFVLTPLVLGVDQVLHRRRLRPGWSPLLLVGYGLYRAAGRYRLPKAGGPPGMSQGMPERLVTTGAYRVTRNPMYLGHLVFLSGLMALTRSPIAAVLLAVNVPWFANRVREDEQRLRERFGDAYDDYCVRVPRWLSTPVAVSRPSRRIRPVPRRRGWPTLAATRGRRR